MENLCSWQDRTKKDWLTDSLEGRPLQYILHFSFLLHLTEIQMMLRSWWGRRWWWFWCYAAISIFIPSHTLSVYARKLIKFSFACSQELSNMVMMTMIVCNIIRWSEVKRMNAMFGQFCLWGETNRTNMATKTWTRLCSFCSGFWLRIGGNCWW